MTTVDVRWIDARRRLPADGDCVLAAVTGRYPDGEEFWLVLPMHFRRVHPVEETGAVVENRFVDADRVVRAPLGGTTDEQVTHWAELPVLPGTDRREILGPGVPAALATALATD
ncbi:AQJ64_40280 family protein [Actinocatenispora rupis]|uniref:Uncharacterized protein n=1 Tax=Actinocatenispora rupis TaxID=519421 RepID=A0A8J3J3P2_9ACTN|nr:AQJ64_40280 family protein [Actinocatenispora rupis]GID11530.1 hypothetical protein Aru02nite_24190 [Actinocatenispora rupis]